MAWQSCCIWTHSQGRNKDRPVRARPVDAQGHGQPDEFHTKAARVGATWFENGSCRREVVRKWSQSKTNTHEFRSMARRLDFCLLRNAEFQQSNNEQKRNRAVTFLAYFINQGRFWRGHAYSTIPTLAPGLSRFKLGPETVKLPIIDSIRGLPHVIPGMCE